MIKTYKTENGAWIAETEPTLDEKGVEHSIKVTSLVSEEEAVNSLIENLKTL